MNGLRLAFLALALTSAGAFAANHSAGTEAVPYFGRDHKIFVGCRPSVGECFNSCPDHRAIVETDPDRCDPESWRDRFACYCTFHGQT